MPVDLVTVRLFGPSLKFTVPLGFTVKLMVPPLCFEKVSGFGLVLSETMQGVGVGLGFTDPTGDGEGVAVAAGDGLGLAAGDGVGSAPGDGVGVGSAPGLGVGVGDASAGVGVGVGEAVALSLPVVVDPLSIPLRDDMALTFGTSSR